MPTIKREQIVSMNQHYRRFSLDYYLECQEKLGVENIEFWLGASHFYVDSKGYEAIQPVRKKLQDHHIKVVSVTTPSCAYQYQYASQEKEILEESFRYFCNGLRVGAELGADRAVVNSGWGYWNESKDDRFRRSQENLYRIAEYAQTLGITCMMESMRNDETNIVYDIHSAKRMFDAVNHPNLKVMVDNIATGNAGETLEDWFEMFGTDLVHMHFLDGDPYLHNVWGDGNTSLEQQLETINRYHFDGYLVQEIADEKYFCNPYYADVKNMRILEKFME